MTDVEEVVQDFFARLANADAVGAVALLHPDVVWRNTGLPSVRGRRVSQLLHASERRGVTVAVEFHHLAASGDVVLTDRTDTVGRGRLTTSFWVRGTFELRGGLIIVWDDAFSWVDAVRGGLVGLSRLL